MIFSVLYTNRSPNKEAISNFFYFFYEENLDKIAAETENVSGKNSKFQN